MKPYELLAEWSAWGWTLLANHLWQATLFSLLALAASSLLRRAPARARYHIWLFALLKFALPSVLLIFLVEQSGLDLARLTPSAAQSSHAASAIPPILSPVTSPATVLRVVETPASSGESTAVAFTVTTPKTGGLYALITCVWMTGCATLFILWLRRRLGLSAALRKGRAVGVGREFEALERVRSWLGLRRSVRLVITPAVLEPGVWRVWKPVVVLPEGIAESLNDAELEVVLMHEVSHIKRHDNLVGNLQRALCCVFWFHPVVWLIDRRLLAEREQACDDAVVRLSGASEVYANSIAKVCGHCLGLDVAGVSSFAGSDLKRRIERIVSGCAGRKLSALQLMVVVVAALGAATLSVVSGQVNGGVAARSKAVVPEVMMDGLSGDDDGAPVRAGIVRPLERLRYSTTERVDEDGGGLPAQASDRPAPPIEVRAPTELIETPSMPSGALVTLPEALPPPVQEQQVSQPSQMSQPPADAARVAIVRASNVDYGDLSKFTGRYEVDPERAENFVLDVTLEGGKLWLKPSHVPKRRLVRQTETDFSDAHGEFQFTFILDEEDRVVGLRLTSWGRNVTARKLKLPAPSSAGNIIFRLRGYADARIVAVAGTFNDWNQSQLLFAREGDEWVCRVKLPPGIYQYKFIVDGNWIADPGNRKTVHDERGILNSLLSAE